LSRVEARWQIGTAGDDDLDSLGYTATSALTACLAPKDRYLEVPMANLCDPVMQARIRELVGRSCTLCSIKHC